MSGHSKWSQIKHKKEVTDAKKSKIFSQLANQITLATKQGKSGDPKINPYLRDAISKARSYNLPLDNIERAIKRGLNEDSTDQIEQVIFEAYGPGGIALLIIAITDNKNRILGEIRRILNKFNGKLASSGSVNWLFGEKGKIFLKDTNIKISENLELELIDNGLENIEVEDGQTVLYCPKEKIEKLRNTLDKNNIENEVEIVYLAKNPIAIKDNDLSKKLEQMLEEFENQEEIEQVFLNAEF